MQYAMLPSDDLMLWGEPFEEEISKYCGGLPFWHKTSLAQYEKSVVKTIKQTIIEKYGKDTYERKVKGRHLDLLKGDGTWGGMELDHTIEL